ncbi:MAG: hypothetical protein KJO07_10340 [Deltaproteobacteria bacterium]|nr:hypothetical protein [Deltaproteobacteria bacterium]
MSHRLAFVFSSLLLATSAASAQPTMTADRVGVRSEALAAFSVSAWDRDVTSFGVTGLRLDLHGQYMQPLAFGSVGGYLTVPLSYAILGQDDSSGVDVDYDNELDMGNIEVGGVFARTELAPGLSVLGRVGIAIGTADDEDTEPVGFEGFGNISTSFARLTDRTLVIPDSTGLRVSGSALGTWGAVSARADLGVDVPLTDDESTELDPLGRLNLVGSYSFGPVSAGLELATLTNLGDVPDGVDRFLHTVAVGVSSDALGPVGVTAGVVLPLDEQVRDLGYDYSVGAAVTATLP